MEDRQVAYARYNVILIVAGWLFAVASLFVVPYVFGVLGIIMGVIISKNGSKKGLPIIMSSIIMMGIGLMLSGVLLNYTRHFLGI